MALFHFVTAAGAALVHVSLFHAISGPVRSAFDSFDGAQSPAFSIGAAVFGLLLVVGVVDSLRRSR